jgi:hypothetical protein
MRGTETTHTVEAGEEEKKQLRAYPKADPELVDVSTFVAGRQNKAEIFGLRAPRLTLTNNHFCTPLCTPIAHFQIHATV